MARHVAGQKHEAMARRLPESEDVGAAQGVTATRFRAGGIAIGESAASATVALPLAIDAGAAVERVAALTGTLVSRLLHGRRPATSTEAVYLPWWLHDYRVVVSAGRAPPQLGGGRIALETRRHTMAIVPDGSRLAPPDAGVRRLPGVGAPDLERARRALWFEALGRERRRSGFEVTLSSSAVLLVPYHVVYVGGRRIEVIAVDATSGKLDFAIRDALVAALLDARRGIPDACAATTRQATALDGRAVGSLLGGR